MKILYLSSAIPEEEYMHFANSSSFEISPAAYKFNKLLIKGLSRIPGVEVDCMVSNTINKKLQKYRVFDGVIKSEDDVDFYYLKDDKASGVGMVKNYISFIKEWANKNKDKDCAIVCDVLNVSASLSAIVVSKMLKIPTVGIVTDLPEFVGPYYNLEKKPFKEKLRIKINMDIIRKFSSFVFLTEQMNDKVNHSNKPYCVIEGFCDINMESVKNELEDKHQEKVCIYSGSLHREYGIEMLIKAFVKSNLQNAELHIYGDGNYRKEIENICKSATNIKFKGFKPNSTVVKEQLKASALINPRPSHEEYTKYSFPSKTLEYMVSGTPTITTKLPGMPKEYYEYVYLIEEESVEGIEKALCEVLNKSEKELHNKGMAAKEFVLKEKNNISQGNKIVEMIKKFK